MKLTIRFGMAIGIVALAACGQDEYAENVDANAAYTANETVLPADENIADADTLDNQMNQLNETDADNVTNADNAADNTTNGY